MRNHAAESEEQTDDTISFRRIFSIKNIYTNIANDKYRGCCRGRALKKINKYTCKHAYKYTYKFTYQYTFKYT